MIYMKTPTGKRISVDRLTFVCDCPSCGQEVDVSDFLDMLTDPDIDFDETSAVYCDECGKKAVEQAVTA